MPIEIRAVENDAFEKWADLMKQDQAKAMAYIQDVTVDFAHPQVAAERLTLQRLWTLFIDLFR